MTAKKITQPAQVLQVTRDYGKFALHTHNRVLVDDDGKRLVRKDLVKSMRAEGYRPEEPIMAYANEDGTYTIIDGHNRLMAAQSLGIDVYFIAHKRNGKAEWTPLKSSATKKKWTALEVARAFAHEGNADYAELLDYMERTGIKLAQSSSVLFGQSASSGNAAKMVRDGTFVVKNRMNGELLADLVDCASKFIDWGKDERLVSAFSALLFVPGFSPTQMKEKISKYSEFLEKKRDRDGTIEMLDKVYNRNSKFRVELLFEARKVLAKRQSSAMGAGS